MNDYPDWTRLFHLTGTDITIPISIEAADVTLDVNLAAAAVAIDVNLIATDVTLPVSIDAATVTLDVNLTAATATIDINFSDQSVAVFDAAKWFAHQAQQYTFAGTGNAADDGNVLLTSYTIPASKVFFLLGIAWGNFDPDGTPIHMVARIDKSGVDTFYVGSQAGGSVIFDTPFRFTAGQVVNYRVWQFGSGLTLTLCGALWGYLEAA